MSGISKLDEISPMTNYIDIFRKKKKAELHVHLNGLFNTELVKEVLQNENTQIPFGFNISKDLNVLHRKKNLLKYLNDVSPKNWTVS